MALVKVLESDVPIEGPCVAGSGGLYVTSASGCIFRVDLEGEKLEGIGEEIQGTPKGTCPGRKEDEIFVADTSQSAILTVDCSGRESSNTTVISAGTGVTLKGPGAVARNDNKLYLCDSGSLGETTLANPRGSLVLHDLDTGRSSSLLNECLAHPSDVTVSEGGDIIYVAEMFANRVLRLVRSGGDSYHTTVFCQLSGYLGPSALALDESGNLYVARCDLRTISKESVITIIRPTGEQYADLTVPGPELSGLCYDRSQKCLYITENSTKSLFRYSIST
eukprot:TRINITY_DN11515_c0_g1_i1.p1 TRINITY_DN11515_c0_g1~~TRINITY_DN11515_c0_g1_i1.p1  ORF type:complete len:292 (+),score=45.21 TRINITY_DN11515_c0_g1_i1:45-878(+)